MGSRTLLWAACLGALFLPAASQAAEKSTGLAAVGADLTNVPELRGASVFESTQKAALLGLNFAKGTFYISSVNWRNTFQPNTVYLQSPQPSRQLPPGAIIAVWTFAKADSDQRIVKVPDVRSQPVGAAMTQLQTAQLTLAEYASKPAATAVVVDQYPAAGQSVYEGTSVYLVVHQN
jgi:PASTA domain